VAGMGERIDAFRILVEKTDKKVTNWIPKNRWESNIKNKFYRLRIG
jgi:hypothetical protein